MKLGAHMPTSGGVWRALERGLDLGCEAVQIFVKNNLQWLGKPFAPNDLANYAKQSEVAKFHTVFGHTGYLINLAAQPGKNRDLSIQSLIQEIQLASQLELPFLVLHPGAHLGAGAGPGLKQVIAGLNEVFEATMTSSVRIALETTAGQGTCLGASPIHLATIYQGVKCPARLGVCLDTAHLFAAGYDLRSRKGWNGVLQEFESLLGLTEVLAVHLNDSKADLNSHVDRHAGIGQGYIGLKAFAPILNEPCFADIPGCLETPKSPDLHEDRDNLSLLRSLISPRRKRVA